MGAKLVAEYETFQVYEIETITDELANDPEVELLPQESRLFLNSGTIDTSAPKTAVRRLAVAAPGKRLHLVQFAGPVQGEWLEGIRNLGLRVVAYVPQNAYLVQADAAGLAQLQQHAAVLHVQWDGPYESAQKVVAEPTAPSLFAVPSSAQTSTYVVQLLRDEALNADTLALTNALPEPPLSGPRIVLDFLNIVVRLTSAERDLFAARPDVISVHPYHERRRFCERQSQIMAGNLSGTKPIGPGYLQWLAGRGFSQAQFAFSDFVVDVSDSGIDSGTLVPTHPGLYVNGIFGNQSRVAYNFLVGTPNGGSTLAGCDGHGTLNAHVVAGFNERTLFPYVDSAGFSYGLGVCPFVRVGSSVVFDPDEYTRPRLTDLQSRAYHYKARISNNSWGGGATGAYDADSQEMDVLVRDAQPASAEFPASGNQEMVIIVAAGNDGDSTDATKRFVGSPASAKNVITVGASENVQAIGGLDGSGVGDSQANSAADVAAFSSRGPCADGRHKPDLLAPGTHVSGGVFQANPAAEIGTADECFKGRGVSGGMSGAMFFPTGQQLFTASSGTSHAAPAVAGAAALLRQYFINQGMQPPSPAMTKAWLMNSSTYMTGVSGNDRLPSDVQGMGRVNLGLAFDGVGRVVRDQLSRDMFTASGQARRFSIMVTDPAKPLLVTLAWTDAPGSTIGPAYNNNLDLTVKANGRTYKGNVFSGRWSAMGGGYDVKNNVESAYLQVGITNLVELTITAANIVADGVPGNGLPLDQDFALVVYNGEVEPKPMLESAGATVVSEASMVNGAIDPGETVGVSFSLRNGGTLPTQNLIASLQAEGGIVSPSQPQLYGKLSPDGASVERSFTFRARGICGSNVVAALKLADGTNDLGRVTFELPLGKIVNTTVLEQSFDGDSSGLPSGWGTSASGSGVPWQLAQQEVASSPNSVYGSEPENSGAADLFSPAFYPVAGSATLRFKLSFDLEADELDRSKAYDGGVLEVRLGTGTWNDIVTAGATFSSGGYTHTLDATTDNPLKGRRVWSGKSGGFVESQVLLPASWAGQRVQLRWRLGTDTGNFYGGTGWYLDDVRVSEGQLLCAPVAVPPILLGARQIGTDIVFSVLTEHGQTYTIEKKIDPVGGSWSAIGALRGDGSSMSVTNAISGPGALFRLRTP